MQNSRILRLAPLPQDRQRRMADALLLLGTRLWWGSVVAMAYVPHAHAQAAGGGTDPATLLKNICNFILGPFGQSLAVLGIIAIGLSWMFGRASLGLIAGVVGGIVIMFGASYLGSTLIGTGG